MQADIVDIIIESIRELIPVLSKRFLVWIGIIAVFPTFWAVVILLGFAITMATVFIKDSEDDVPLYMGADLVLGLCSIGAYTSITGNFLAALVAVVVMYVLIYGQELEFF